MDNSAIFDTFNARYLTFEQVAKTFVPTNQFSQLISNSHSLIMGPRGSGKTTSLKMLSPLSLLYWNSTEANNYKNKIPFWGIYIPCDIRWKKEIERVEFKNKKIQTSLELISKALVINIVCNSMLQTFQHLISVQSSEKQGLLEIEAELSTGLVELWELEKPISPNFYAIEFGIQMNINRINKIRNEVTNNIEVDFPSSWYLDYFSLICSSISLFENICRRYDLSELIKTNWAVCFDELEIAPQWLQNSLFELLRSTSEQNILLKLTTSPIVNLEKNISGRPGHDYNIIRMWTFNQQEFTSWNQFCDRLVSNRIENEIKKRILPEAIFGKYSINLTVKSEIQKKYIVRETKGDFDKGSLMWYLIKDLASYDDSFRDYLLRKEIDIKNPTPKNQEEEDKIHRKIKPIIIHRYLFNKEDSKRTRKNVPMFFGLKMLYELCDGNPRSIIGLINKLLPFAKKNNKNKLTRIPILTQSRVISETSRNYFDLICSHPEAVIVKNDKLLLLEDILKKLGYYFQDQLLNVNFSADPKGIFKVDKNVSKDIINILELALYLGAIIYLDPKESFSNSSLIGKQFRLTYLLSPYLRLPKIRYKSRDLSYILNQQQQIQENFFYSDENTMD